MIMHFGNSDALLLAVLTGLMMVLPPSPDRIQTPRASLQRLISRITSSASSASIRQRQAVKYFNFPHFFTLVSHDFLSASHVFQSVSHEKRAASHRFYPVKP